MTLLLTLIAFHFIVLIVGKSVKRVNYLGYLVIGIITSLQVGLFLYLLYTMEVPTP